MPKLVILLAALPLILAGAMCGAGADTREQVFTIAAEIDRSAEWDAAATIATVITSPLGAWPCERGGKCGVPGLIAQVRAVGSPAEAIDLLSKDRVGAVVIRLDLLHRLVSQPQPPISAVRTVSRLFDNTVHIVVRRGAGIAALHDLQGKRLGVGDDDLGIVRTILAPQNLREVSIVRVGQNDAREQLADGRLDAFVLIASAPNPMLAQLNESTPIDLLALATPTGDGTTEAAEIRAGTYDGVAATPSLHIPSVLAVPANADNETILQILKALSHPRNRPQMSEEAPTRTMLGLNAVDVRAGIPVHAGAEQFFQSQPIRTP